MDKKITQGRVQDDYSNFSRDELVEEILFFKKKLEEYSQEGKTTKSLGRDQEGGSGESSERRKTKMTSKNHGAPDHQKEQKKSAKELNFKEYSQRKIALTISYRGTEHGGLAWQPEVTKLSTVEGELFKALLVSRLVERNSTSDGLECVDFHQPEHLIQCVDLEKWGYSRAGRTDAGVSGSGQVVSLWVRSRLKSAPARFGFRKMMKSGNNESVEVGEEEAYNQHDSIQDELGYHTILNSVLPSTVRVLAWSPVSEQFDARFSCQARHYKYFFSLYENPHGPPLDIHAMRQAAQRLVGEHDFRNFCKMDPSKQINNFHRRIISAQINPVEEQQDHHHTVRIGEQVGVGFSRSGSVQSNPMFVLDLMGTAFLYNMVRHIVSILFLIGSGVESVDLIDRMFYTQATKEPRLSHSSEKCMQEPVESKPEYIHANALPLLFHRSIYPEGSFEWIPTPLGSMKPASSDLFTTWSRDRLRALLSLHHLKTHLEFVRNFSNHKISPCPPSTSSSFYQPLGAAELRPSAHYLPILERPRAAHFSVINANWWQKIGAQKFAKRQFLPRS